MNKSVDLARLRSALSGKRLLGFKLAPIDGILLGTDKPSKTGWSAKGELKVGAVKVGAKKIGMKKAGLGKRGLVKRES